MSSLIAPHGGTYQSYAPRHGGICFVHIDVNGSATNAEIPRDIAKKLTPEGWILTDYSGRFEAVRPIRRVGRDWLEQGENLYRHAITAKGHEFYFWAGDQWEILRNESQRASLRYFLATEALVREFGREGAAS